MGKLSEIKKAVTPGTESLDECKARIERAAEGIEKVDDAALFAGVDGDWVPLGEQAPGREAWCDTPGVLDIEVPWEHGDALAAWVEEQGARVGIERGSNRYCCLHINFLLSQPVAEVSDGS